MRRFDTYLSGSFQPSIFFDFGEGKLFSNKFAESLRPFPFMSGKTDNGQPIYSYNDNSGRYEKTDRICPRCVAGIGNNESNNIKVDMANVVLLGDEGILFNRGDVEPMIEVGYRPSVIAMPQHAPISHNGVVYGAADPILPVDGELFSMVVEPNIDLMFDIDNTKYTTHEYITGLIRKSSVLLCADRRRFKAEAYNSYEYSPEDVELDEIKYKFKVGDEYCDFISLGVGSIIKMRCVVDGDDVYWVVENHNAFEPLSAVVNIGVNRYYDEGSGEMVSDYNYYQYEGMVYASRYICDAQRKITEVGAKFVEYSFDLSDNSDYDWRDRVIDLSCYEDY